MTERLERAIDVFLDAINNGTLAKGSCSACAVGNLVAVGMGGVVKNHDSYFDSDVENTKWTKAFLTDEDGQLVNEASFDHPGVIECVEATEFSLEELMKIEYAFETNTKIHVRDYGKYAKQEILQDQIRGLEAVVKVMMTFDEVEADIKEVFTNKIKVQA